MTPADRMLASLMVFVVYVVIVLVSLGDWLGGKRRKVR